MMAEWKNFSLVPHTPILGQSDSVSAAASEQNGHFLRLEIVQAGEPVLREVARTVPSAEIESDQIQRLIRPAMWVKVPTEEPGSQLGELNLSGLKGGSDYRAAEYIQLKGTICRSLVLPALPCQPQTQAISSEAGSVADLRCRLILSWHFGHSRTSW
jgi:hypothetical protein